MSNAYYKHLLAMRRQTSLSPLVEKALELIVEVTHARTGYLALHGENGQPELVRVRGTGDLSNVEARLSNGIIEKALSSRRPVLTPSAITDRRFEKLDSVRRHELQAVLCVPVGEREPIGVVYLERAMTEFTSEDVNDAQLLAFELEAHASRLVRRSGLTLPQRIDEVRLRVVREAMERNGNCASAAAKELGVKRVTIYRNIKK